MGVFLMPSLGADMEAGKLVEQLKQPGDTIRHGDVIAVVETQKGAIEIEAFEDGILGDWKVEIGTEVPVGTPLTSIGDIDELEPDKTEADKMSNFGNSDGPTSDFQPDIRSEPPSKIHFEKPHASPSVEKQSRLHITPAARQLAESSKLDLNETSINGSGPDGAITLVDVETHLKKAPEAAEASTPPDQVSSEGYDFSAMRAAIASAMTRSKRDIPHYYLSHTIDLTKAEKFVSAQNENASPDTRLLMGALFMKAVVNSIAKFPEFNGYYEDDKFGPVEAVNAGMAINIRGGGLAAPAILNAQNMDLKSMMEAMRDLVGRVRSGRFRASELSDSTITVSSMGDRGVDTLFGVIYPPQVAIIGFGTPALKPVVFEDSVVAHTIVSITLAADHRVSDGHRGALFLKRIDKLLQEPEAL